MLRAYGVCVFFDAAAAHTLLSCLIASFHYACSGRAERETHASRKQADVSFLNGVTFSLVQIFGILFLPCSLSFWIADKKYAAFVEK